MTKKLLATPLAERVRAVVFHRRVVFGVPFAWLLLFFLLPFALVLLCAWCSVRSFCALYAGALRCCWPDAQLA